MSAPRWDGPRGLWSQWEMLNVNAKHFVQAGEVLRTVDQVLLSLSPAGAVNTTALLGVHSERVMAAVRGLGTHTQFLGLRVTRTLVDQFINASNANPPTVYDTIVAVTGMREAFKAELDSHLFLQVYPHRIVYYTREHFPHAPFVGNETKTLLDALANFKDAHFDATEAGNCLAFGRATAAVYHLMRIAEYGLVSVATAAHVGAVEHRSWDKMIAGIHKHIKLIESQKPDGWIQERKRFSDVCSWLTVIKSGWRNPVSHIPRSYSETTATSIFAAVRTLFEQLNVEGFGQVPMPETIINPEDEDGAAGPSAVKQLHPAIQSPISEP